MTRVGTVALLRAHMANLSRKIEPAGGAGLIHTDPGVGYRLADVRTGAARRRPSAQRVSNTGLVRSPVSA